MLAGRFQSCTSCAQVAISQCSSQPVAMSFDLSASTTVTFSGPVHLHGWLSHSFSGQSGSNLFLTSRARQFSSMVVLVGRVTSATTFDPTYAAIVQNKDELTIPLELSVIPTPKEFKDAIASLSPSQQAFAKAFRATSTAGLSCRVRGSANVWLHPNVISCSWLACLRRCSLKAPFSELP